MTDYGPLDAAVNAIRPANPKIAACFDEVEKILKTVAPPTPPPPVTAPINTNGKSDMTIENVDIELPPEFVDYNKACVYVSGASKRTDIGPGVKLVGAYVTLKVYCANVGDIDTLTINGADISGTGGDCMHFDGATNVYVDNVRCHGFINQGTEHHDGVQIQSGHGYYFGPGVEIDQSLAFPNNGFMISEFTSAKPCYDVTIDRCKVVLDPADPDPSALQMFVAGKIISPTIQCSNAIKVIIGKPPRGGIIELHSASTGMWSQGVKRADVFITGQGTSGPWPSWVRVF